jgi:hypothetical protein
MILMYSNKIYLMEEDPKIQRLGTTMKVPVGDPLK